MILFLQLLEPPQIGDLLIDVIHLNQILSKICRLLVDVMWSHFRILVASLLLVYLGVLA